MKTQKSSSWYMFAGVAALALIMWGIFEQMYALSVVVIILCGVYVMVENNAPESIMIEVGENGILVGEDFYDFAKIANFGFIYENSTPLILRLRLRKQGLRLIDIGLSSEINASDLRAFLGNYLEESENTDFSFGEKITRMLGI